MDDHSALFFIFGFAGIITIFIMIANWKAGRAIRRIYEQPERIEPTIDWTKWQGTYTTAFNAAYEEARNRMTEEHKPNPLWVWEVT